jgi:hypothetical protein
VTEKTRKDGLVALLNVIPLEDVKIVPEDRLGVKVHSSSPSSGSKALTTPEIEMATRAFPPGAIKTPFPGPIGRNSTLHASSGSMYCESDCAVANNARKEISNSIHFIPLAHLDAILDILIIVVDEKSISSLCVVNLKL